MHHTVRQSVILIRFHTDAGPMNDRLVKLMCLRTISDLSAAFLCSAVRPKALVLVNINYPCSNYNSISMQRKLPIGITTQKTMAMPQRLLVSPIPIPIPSQSELLAPLLPNALLQPEAYATNWRLQKRRLNASACYVQCIASSSALSEARERILVLHLRISYPSAASR